MMYPDLTNCRNCSHTVNSNFCGHCGQPVNIKRVDSHYILHEIQHVLHFEKGILYTIKELLIRPGQNIKEFIGDNRSRLVKPILFIIITSLIYTIINHFFHIEKGYIVYTGTEKSAVGSIVDWVQNHYGYGNIIMGIFISFWLKLFFKKYSYNFFEILILLCFVMGVGMLIFSFFAVIEGLTKYSLMKVSGPLGVAYCTWAIAQFFNKKKAGSYIKAFIAYTLGMITFSIAIGILGTLIDNFTK